ncbi:MAG: AAA family ATPase [Planctomyces sp.]|nr:AAA family ATPase [Planctomyces sp.]
MDAMIRGLLRPEAFDHPVEHLELLETHISWVILTGSLAYKIKKPVSFGFVDFSTLERRRTFCHEEIRLNRRLAPDLYLSVEEIRGSADAPRLHGAGPPFEYAVRMREFPQDALLTRVLARGELLPRHVDGLARTIAKFHAAADVASERDTYGDPESVRRPETENLDILARLTPEAPILARLRTWCDAEYARRRDWFASRKQLGRVRDCHGDMHLGNMLLLDDAVQVFDCLEFNPGLRWTDVIAEIAFVVMDLQERGSRPLAYRLLNVWLEESGDYAALSGWPWYFVYRALVRAKVAALRLAQSDVPDEERRAKTSERDQYLALAESASAPRGGALILLHGVSGTGKSHAARRLCEQLPAVRLRSDVERKRLFGKWGQPREPVRTGDLYDPAVADELYGETLPTLAGHALDGGFHVVVDATFLMRDQRDRFRRLARERHVPFVLLDLQASRETLARRIRERAAAGHDPSDADLAILDQQLASRQPLGDDELSETLSIDAESDGWADDLPNRIAARLAH